MAGLYSNAKREMTVQKGCPWYEAQQEYGAANVNWCEPTICSIVNEPANTWSNISFLLIGALLIRKFNSFKEKVITHYAWSLVIMGLCSLTYHATNNYLTQFLDFLGMFFGTGFVIAFNIQRIRGENPRQLYSWYWFMTFFSTALFLAFDFTNIPVQMTVLVQVIGILVLDLIAGYKEGNLKNYKWFVVSTVLLVIAQVFSQLDLKRIWCEPENRILHGHAIWHLIASLGLGTLGLHLREMLKLSKFRS
jgi:predicted membrane channel-forming protein YqfA (hemolysin III family)